MLRNLRISLARRRIARWQRRRGVLAFLATWLPVWCGLAVLLWVFTQIIGCAFLLIIPVVVVGRYFIARRRADIVLRKIYTIVRLNHPLAEGLRAAGASERGAVGVRLEMLAELLQRGLTLAESMQLAMPELRASDFAAITEAERAGRLLPELARLTSKEQAWNIVNELDGGLLIYFASFFGVFIITFLIFTVVVEPKLRKAFGQWGVTFPGRWLQFSDWLSRRQAEHVSATIATVVVIALFIAAGAILRRLAIPFFRRGNVSIYLRDAVVWRLPIAGPLIRWRAWSDGTRILAQGMAAGQPLPEVSQSAAIAVSSRVARRRLRLWGERMLAGMPADAAAGKSGLPQMVCRAVAQPLGSTGSALALAAGYYDLKYRRRTEVIRAASIPLVVLCMGMLVLMLCLALYVPYVELLQVAGRSGGGS